MFEQSPDLAERIKDVCLNPASKFMPLPSVWHSPAPVRGRSENWPMQAFFAELDYHAQTRQYADELRAIAARFKFPNTVTGRLSSSAPIMRNSKELSAFLFTEDAESFRVRKSVHVLLSKQRDSSPFSFDLKYDLLEDRLSNEALPTKPRGPANG